MAEITKQALKVQNNTEFPNNNNGAITPSNLRGFNVNMIDSLVDEIGYNADSASWNQQIDALEAFTASASGLTTGSLLVTASAAGNVITFRKGDSSTFNVTVATGSIPDISNLNQATASLQAYTASANIRFTNLESTTASLNTSVTNINTFTASAGVSITNLNASSASQQVSINNLNGATGSYATTGSNIFVGANTFTSISASSFVSASEFIGNGSKITGITASISMPILDEGIPQGNAFSMNFTGSAISAIVVGGTAVVSVNVPDTGSFNALTASFNAYTASTNSSITQLNASTASQQISIDALNTNSASVNTSITNVNSATASLFTSVNNINTFTQSAQTSINSLNAATSSYVTSAITASSLVTASAVGNTITFTKGDASTFNVSISSTPIDTGSFATTASFNAYTQSNDQRVTSLEANSASVNTSITNINSATSSLFTSASLGLTTASFAAGTLTFTKGNGTTFGVVIPDVSGSVGTTIVEVVYTGESITKGDPLYISGSQGANPRVFKADAADPNKMPVTFVSNETIGAANTTNAIVLGLIEGIDLTGYVAGQTIYVAEGGGWSANLPSGSNSVTQLLGVVTKGGSGGKGLVLNPGPAQLPGLDTGYMWVGGANNQPTEITTASFASSASFNSYTSSTNSRLTNIESTTASLNTSVSNLNTFSASALVSISNLNTNSASVNTSITNINSATASLFTSASLGLTTASFSGNTLTFTKGDATTFGVVIPDVSGSTINTGSFATTGSNTFNGNQTVNGLVTQNIGAAGTESQKDFVVVTGSVIDGKTYSQVTFGLQDYPSLGDDYKDAFAIDYFDSTNFAYGTTFAQNGIRVGTQLLASGSGNSFGGKGYGISQLRQLFTGSFLNQYASIISIGSYAPSTTDYILIGHNALPYLQLSSLSNQITGSTIISGSNGLRLIGNQTITGSLILSSSAATELQVIGDTQFTGSLIMSSSNAVELTVIGNSVFTGSAFGNVISASITSNTASINLNIGNYFTLSIPTGTTRISPSNIQAGTSATLVITTASGSLVTFDSSVKQPSGSAYIPTSGSVDILSFVSVNSSSLFVVATKNMI
jgi:hypothetical protein